MSKSLKYIRFLSILSLFSMLFNLTYSISNVVKKQKDYSSLLKEERKELAQIQKLKPILPAFWISQIEKNTKVKTLVFSASANVVNYLNLFFALIGIFSIFFLWKGKFLGLYMYIIYTVIGCLSICAFIPIEMVPWGILAIKAFFSIGFMLFFSILMRKHQKILNTNNHS